MHGTAQGSPRAYTINRLAVGGLARDAGSRRQSVDKPYWSYSNA